VISSRLCDEGVQVRIICLEKDVFYDLPKEIEIVHLKTNRAHFILSLRFFELFYFALKLRSVIREKKIKIVQSHLFRANYVNLLAKILGSGHRAQVVNTVAVGSKYNKKAIKGILNLFLIKMLYPLADDMIFKSKAMAYDFKEHFSFNIRCTIINNPCNEEIIKKLSMKKDDNIVIEINKNTIISVGRLETHKHHELLIAVYKLLLQDFPRLNLLIIGEGPERKNIEKTIEKLGIKDRVQLPGRVQNPFYYLVRAGLYVSCSESEGFPNALLEAMACSLPVVSSDCLSGPREILDPESDPLMRLESGYECAQYGILFGVNDKDALKKAIAELISDEVLYKQYKEKSKRRIKDYKLNTIIEQYKSVLGLFKD